MKSILDIWISGAKQKKSEGTKYKKQKSINKRFKIPLVHLHPLRYTQHLPQVELFKNILKKNKRNCKTGPHLNKKLLHFIYLCLYWIDDYRLLPVFICLMPILLKKNWPFQTQNYICINTHYWGTIHKDFNCRKCRKFIQTFEEGELKFEDDEW